MGVLNVTPDSFSDGGAFLDAGAAIARGVQMVEEGADAIDVGGESTRPGSRPVDAAEELRRVVPVVRALAKAVRVPISIDTSKAAVAEQALEAGASILNDVTALRGDAAMARLAARMRATVILMHMRGAPRTMQRAPRYGNVVEEVAASLRRAVRFARASGIARGRIFIDPGLGFGKTARHNLQLLQRLDRLTALGFPVVVGASRKSFIGKILGADVDDRLSGSLACVVQARRHGAHMVRVHDVKATAHLLRMLNAIEAGR